LVKQLAGLQRTDIEAKVAWEQASRLKMPLLMIRGALSDVISPGTVARLQQVLPHAVSVEIPGVSHSPTLYEPESQAAIRDFLGIAEPALAAETAL